VPADLHAPIRQDAVLLVHGADNDAAAAFLAFLKSDAARSKIVTLGYGTE
jgi:molybdate transport system substrate-binding protein